jgi:hypothetical protein
VLSADNRLSKIYLVLVKNEKSSNHYFFDEYLVTQCSQSTYIRMNSLLLIYLSQKIIILDDYIYYLNVYRYLPVTKL